MTKKNNLTTFMIVIMIMLFSLPANAQGTVGYAQWDELNTTLTFKGGGSVPDGAYALNTGYNSPGWKGFSRCTIVKFDESFKDVRPTSCYRWFDAFTQLTTIEGIENLNTEEVTNMSYMFNSCKVLENLDLSSFNTAKVEDMGYMFSVSYRLTSLDLSSFNTAKVTNMSCMFSGCSGLTSLDLSSFNTAKVENMSYMFIDCSSLTSLDLSSFNTAKVTDMTSMFNGCSSLNKIYVSDDFTTGEVSSSDGMFYGCSYLNGKVSYDSEKTDHNMANYGSGYFTESNLTPCVKWNAYTNVLTFKVANYIEGTAGECEFNEGAIALEGVDLKINCKKVVFTPSFKQVTPTSCYKWFYGFSSLTTIQGIENLNTEEVDNMSYMFNGCSYLTSLDLSSFNTDKVENMSYMFYGCSTLTSLDLSSFNTDKVENMSGMFYNCRGLTSLGVSKLNTAKVENMSYMFYNCWGLTSLDVSSFNTAEVLNIDRMFGGCRSLTSLDVSKFNTAKVTDMGYMFSGCSGLTSLDLSSFSTAKVTNMRGMFNGCSGLTSLDLSSFNTAEVTNMREMFYSCSDLTSLDLSSFNTAKVTDMNYMFNTCSSLTSLDLSSFNTAKVTDMSFMFERCSGLTSLDLSSFNTAEVTNMSNMFDRCKVLTSLDLSSFNTAEVKNMNYIFYNCYGLSKIYVSDDFTTKKVSNSMGMFDNCSQLVGAASYDSNKTDHSMANYKDGYFKTYFTLGENKVELWGYPLTTESLDLSGEKDFVAHAPFKANTANYSRDLSSSGATWFSLCLPFAYTPGIFTAYQLKSATAEAVEIEEMTGEIVAGTPVLFKFKDGEVKKINISETDANIVKAPVDGAAVSGTDRSSLRLCGTYQTKSFSSEDNNAFILLNNKLMNPAKMLATTGVTKVGVKPFRGYMTLTASAGATSAPASARAFSIGRGGEGNEGTTAIDLLNSVATDDAEYYDINGRRIDAPAKGVNIVRRGNKTIKLIIK